MKKKIKSVLSGIPYLRQLKRRLLAYQCYFSDIRRHLKFSLYYRTQPDSQDSLRCAIMLLNHQLEKAQTYKSVKEGFGHEKLLNVLAFTDEYIRKYGADDLTEVTMGILAGHFANIHAWKDETSYAHFLKLKEVVSGDIKGGGVFAYEGNKQPRLENFEGFLASRRSCRQFAPRIPNEAVIRKAVKLAQWAPSACNRQPIRVHVYTNPERIRHIIAS